MSTFILTEFFLYITLPPFLPPPTLICIFWVTLVQHSRSWLLLKQKQKVINDTKIKMTDYENLVTIYYHYYNLWEGIMIENTFMKISK